MLESFLHFLKRIYSTILSYLTTSSRPPLPITTKKMSFRPAIASMSLGVSFHLFLPSTSPAHSTNISQRAWVHDLPSKFQAAAAAGLPGIEIFFEDLLYLADTYPGGRSQSSNQLLAAHSIRSLASSLNLELIACGPFQNCEGVLDASKKAEKLEELHLWFQICHTLGTDIIQIPCTFMQESEGMTGDIDIVVRDLQEIADLGAKQNPPFRFAFENLCFGTFFDTWENAWDVVSRVDRDNFGLCLDTYNIAGKEYGDPLSPTGKIENAEVMFKESMKKMARTIDPAKIFYIQVVDGTRLTKPLDENHEFYVEGQKPRMSWSRNARLFVCEEERGGYLPALEVVRAITDEKEGLGYKGWISMELFNRSLCEEGKEVPKEHAERAMKSWWRMVERMDWNDEVDRSKVVAKSVVARPQEIGQVEVSARL
jgi:4-hydroxyphenylpyruvate dioxygenase